MVRSETLILSEKILPQPFFRQVDAHNVKKMSPLGVISISFVSSLLNSKTSELMYSVAMNLKTCVTATIYGKSLRMSGAAKRVSTGGEIVNLMSVDVQRFMDLLPFLYMLWSVAHPLAFSAAAQMRELRKARLITSRLSVVASPSAIRMK
jgi:hypothetical protein